MKLLASSPENLLANFSANLSSNLSSFIGVCYVLRGASLGGKVIARHLDDTLRLDAAHGAAFFNAESGDGLGWVQWMRSADQVLLAENDLDAACLSAGATFALLLKLFSEPQDSVTISASKLVDPAAAGADMDRL